MKLLQTVAVLLLLSISNTSLLAQSDLPIPNWHFMDKATVPMPSDDMPEYARLLYADEVNIIELEQAFRAHYEREGWDEQLEDLERDPYAKFFNFWYQGAQNYIDDDGMVRALNTRDLLEEREKSQIIDEQYMARTGNRSPTSTWSFLGPKRTIWRADDNASQPVAPWQVNIYCMAVAPSNPSILYAGSETGALYKSIDKGLNWTPFNAYNWGRAILSIAIHPTDPNIVYAATSSDIFKTTTGGTSWSIVLTESGLSCNALAINPDSPTTILAGTANGLYLSSDSGATWSEKLSELIYDVEFRPNDGTTIYALAKNDVPDPGTDTYWFYKSTDSGATFNLSMANWGDINISSGGRLTVTPGDEDYVYAMLTSDNSTPYIMKTTDSAINWTTVATGGTTAYPLNNGQGYYDLDIVASHSNPEQVMTGTGSAYRSIDGGINWTAVGGYQGNFSIHPDIQSMVSIMDGTTENTWIATDGGVNFSSDFYAIESNWEARIDGLDGTDFWGFAQGWNEDYIIGGRYHNGNTAIHENYPDQQALRMGGAESVTGWAMHGRERYAAFDDISEAIIPDQIDEPVEGSFLFTKHPQTYYYGDAFSRVMIDLEDYMTIYLGDGNSFWRSQDGGGSWDAIFTFSGKPYHFDISRANPEYIYLTTDDGFYRSTDRGENFTQMSLPPGMGIWHSQNFRVAASSSDANTVWVLNQRSGATSTAGRIFVSNNGGASWTDLSTATTAGRKWSALAHQAGTDGGIYLASNRGEAGTNPAKIIYRDNSMSDWVDFSNGFPESANPIKLLPFYRDGKLRWGGNRGAWEVDFYEDNWTPIAQPFVSGKTQSCIRDTVEFDSYSVAKGTATYAWSIPGASWTSLNLNQREVQALFPADGTYTATLTITQDGNSDSKSIDITVSNECEAEQTPGNALSLLGQSTDYAATNSALDVTTNTMTMSAWIKRNGDQNSYAGILFMRQGTACGLNFRENNELGFHWNNSQWWWSSGLTPPDGEWAHVAMVVTPSAITLYLNGEAATNTNAAAAMNFDGVMNFGADPNWSSRRFNGDMDEVIIYNRSLSQDEIRELMHLTRTPASETDLIGYWQFNRASGTIMDRAGSNHASLIGSAARSTSTAPVGPGESARLDVLTGGAYTFGTTDLTLEFPAGGTTFPDGEICVTRLDHAPDQAPGDDVSDAYWIVHNYGNNSSFDELTSLTFNNIAVTNSEAANPAILNLDKRGSNEDGDTWSVQDNGDEATAGINGNVVFSTGNGQTSFSQFIISKKTNPLDAELLEFKAWLNNEKNVVLKWISASEKDLAHYEVQRSKDGSRFETFDQISAAGNSSTILLYQSLDSQPYHGQSYYRLKMVDLDGSIVYSDVRSIVINALADKVILYPNPLPGNQDLQAKTELEGEIEIRLYTVKGEDVGEFKFEGSAAFSLDHLPKGAYSYIIRSAHWRKAGVLIIE